MIPGLLDPQMDCGYSTRDLGVIRSCPFSTVGVRHTGVHIPTTTSLDIIGMVADPMAEPRAATLAEEEGQHPVQAGIAVTVAAGSLLRRRHVSHLRLRCQSQVVAYPSHAGLSVKFSS